MKEKSRISVHEYLRCQHTQQRLAQLEERVSLQSKRQNRQAVWILCLMVAVIALLRVVLA